MPLHDGRKRFPSTTVRIIHDPSAGARCATNTDAVCVKGENGRVRARARLPTFSLMTRSKRREQLAA